MTDDTLLPFDLPAVQRKKVTADFTGGSISSDGGLVLLRAAERRLGLAEALTGCIRECRDPDRVPDGSAWCFIGCGGTALSSASRAKRR